MTMHNTRDPLVVTAFWEAAAGEEETVAAILSRFAPQARQEPGVVNFVILVAALSAVAELRRSARTRRT